jgi:exodeoxyribonuclease III
MEGYWCYWHGGKGYSGVALQVSHSFARERPAFSHPTFDYENRIVTVDLATPLGDVTVASIYVPNGGKDFPAKIEFLHQMEAFVTETHARGQQLVLCGDLNIARTERDVHPKERNPALVGQRPEERALFERILDCGLVDVGRALDPNNDNLFTWWAPWRKLRERNIGWRLDYVLASDALAAKAIQCTAYREVGTSDHGPVIAVFDVDGSTESTGQV